MMAVLQYTCFVDLSIWQALGYTAFEGMSYGVVPVMKENSGLSRYIVNNTNGLLIVDDNSCVIHAL